ncbi:hypothetical protein LEMLEM_LOCUS20106 [Lemmus lemmus]
MAASWALKVIVTSKSRKKKLEATDHIMSRVRSRAIDSYMHASPHRSFFALIEFGTPFLGSDAAHSG